ncbi:MAG: ATP-binding protein [Myxococcota bacterium]
MLNALAQQLQDAVLRCAQHEATVRKLEQAQRQLLCTAKLASLGELAAGVAHELNQPLQIVGLSVDEVRDALERADHATATEYLQTIEDQVTRGAGVVDRLLALSRHDGESTRTQTSLDKVITGTVSIWGAPLAALGIDLSTDLAIGLGDVVGDSQELLQVITNLVANARDALEGQPTRRICLRTTAELSHACIEVIDTGSGIAPDDLPRVFDPFFTTKGPGKGPGKDPGKGPGEWPGRGTGLGLSVSHGIVRRHGGTIEVFSELNHGTRVRITLPFAEAP